jgi:2OG-Fe(II) oxygenase superfamily
MSGKNELSSQTHLSIQEFKSAHWNVVLITNFLTSAEADKLMKEGESLFAAQGKIQKRRTNLTLGEREGMKYKVTFGYGASARTTIRETLTYESIPSLPDIRNRVEKMVNSEKNVSLPMCAALRYPSGKYGIKRHRDREVPAGSIIAGLSVGEIES